jgi:hypothetical protein
MKNRLTAAILAALAVGLIIVSAASAAGLIGIYRNSMDTAEQRAQLVKLFGRSCGRAGPEGALKITVGKKTETCAFRTPVVGRDVEIAATERLLSGTPKAMQRKAYLGLETRAGGGTRYQLLVYPLQRKVQVLKVTSEGTEFLAIAKNQKAVAGLNKANTLRLRTFNFRGGPSKGQTAIVAYVGSTQVANVTDEEPEEVTGANTAIAVGAPKNASGVVASADDVVVRVPSPY